MEIVLRMLIWMFIVRGEENSEYRKRIYLFYKVFFFFFPASRHLLCCINRIVSKLWECQTWTASSAQQHSFHLNWNNALWQFSDVCIIIWTQRHCSEQDGHDEQVIVVKQICKCETIAFRVMVCLWISRVIVPLQLGYLHNQLSGLAIMCTPPLLPYLLQSFHCNWLPALYSILFMRKLLYACMYCTVLHDMIKSR